MCFPHVHFPSHPQASSHFVCRRVCISNSSWGRCLSKAAGKICFSVYSVHKQENVFHLDVIFHFEIYFWLKGQSSLLELIIGRITRITRGYPGQLVEVGPLYELTGRIPGEKKNRI